MRGTAPRQIRPMIDVWNRFLADLARKLWHFRYRRGARIGTAVLSFSAGRGVESVYGPRLMKNRGDKTFVFCLAGYYGQARFVMPEGHSGMARLSDTEGMLTVKTRDLDFFSELATRSTNPVVVKIDVGGAEHDVVTELTASDLIARVTRIHAEIAGAARGPDNAWQKIEAMLREKRLEIEGPRSNWRHRNVMFARALEPAAPAP